MTCPCQSLGFRVLGGLFNSCCGGQPDVTHCNPHIPYAPTLSSQRSLNPTALNPKITPQQREVEFSGSCCFASAMIGVATVVEPRFVTFDSCYERATKRSEYRP